MLLRLVSKGSSGEEEGRWKGRGTLQGIIRGEGGETRLTK